MWSGFSQIERSLDQTVEVPSAGFLRVLTNLGHCYLYIFFIVLLTIYPYDIKQQFYEITFNPN